VKIKERSKSTKSPDFYFTFLSVLSPEIKYLLYGNRFNSCLDPVAFYKEFKNNLLFWIQ
jgi:hypothetical protein